MDNIIDTAYPAAELPLRLFLVLLVVTACILGNILRPDEPNIILFSCCCCLIIFIILYFTYRQRGVDFDGKEFTLEDALNRSEIIDASLFKEINSIAGTYYKIKFTNGKSYLFILNNSSFYTKVIFTYETEGFDKRLTKRIKESIEKRSQNENM